MKLLVINGPNLNLLGIREPDVYGHESYGALVAKIKAYADAAGITVDVRQFNSEGAVIDAIQESAGQIDGLILNAGAYSHYSYAIHDAIKGTSIDAVEVHLSNIAAREAFRRESVTAPACIGQISGLGFEGYTLAMQYFISRKR